MNLDTFDFVCIALAWCVIYTVWFRWRVRKDMQEIFEKMQEALVQAQLEREEHEEYLENYAKALKHWGETTEIKVINIEDRGWEA